ncbi:sigma-70 family RNA polymerase sigma factor [Spongiactinospora sp. TRM90649]|uniref:RNA polymerase sigma factor n=1 Tax=Spongiactinospora sp. TRM90649 TaxID=3031114 RepID=UPI0023F8A773|nr:sigma-70 family RNA polymerase sigma factor [Spongiactinospora sp. TRM90649]MDF5753811.1 sigma-70 family RNA polymerase sigma factor [Spongiactinospora sp. TRM90649]
MTAEPHPVLAAAGGDADAWRALVDRYQGLVWAVARGYGLGGGDAEEVFQVTWLRLAEHIARIKDPDRVGAWLAATARNEALRALRRGGRLRPTGDPQALETTDDRSPEVVALETEAAAEADARTAQLWLAFQALPERCRRLLRVLIADPSPGYAAAAEALGMPVGSIGPTRARCLTKLRVLLAARGITDAAGGPGDA